jgi:L,D-peptidoglycan transpeptidase YkuD (ErfK/YbiS/YcfS/YnhG family)
MIIHIKNKDLMVVDDFKFKCCVGKNGIKKKKVEGDNSTPRGTFKLKTLYFRSDRLRRPDTLLKTREIKKDMGWCNDSSYKYYNKQIKRQKKISSEKLFRQDSKYDYLIVIDYNLKKRIPYKGSAIFIHLTNNYRPTAGCVALKKKNFEILLKLINQNSKIRIN